MRWHLPLFGFRVVFKTCRRPPIAAALAVVALALQPALADRASLPTSDREFLWRLAHDTWRGLEALTDRRTGLPWDHVLLRAGSVATVQAHPGDYVTTSSVGLYLVAVVAAHELGLIEQHAAEARIGRVIDSLERLDLPWRRAR